MPQITNAKRVLHKYIGQTQTYKDTVGVWQEISWSSSNTTPSSGTVQFMDIGGMIIFKENLLFTSNSTNGSLTIKNIPSQYTNLQFKSIMLNQESWSNSANIADNESVTISGRNLSLSFSGIGQTHWPLINVRLYYGQQN
ncbi:hypothetical protein HC026_02045 [Lactobacillus sp. LC28-10]|uniref:Uncharacterized protein n=1 Tax=Secundilactobacillus angelensis TaxID=2722706 RepID=A0ABX1KUT3_9LACO|nr:hypothetical protein [Secundilactobacillus angelensis]MCH5461491.1 hypothetical protein [Secundilactobacillus angelensis]NLR17696.1 hypothetical protein [Secundilactobacillus angelensis]